MNNNIYCGYIDTFNKIVYGFSKKKEPLKYCKLIDGQKVLVPVSQKHNIGLIYVSVCINKIGTDGMLYGYINEVIGKIGDVDAEILYLDKCVKSTWKKTKYIDTSFDASIDLTQQREDLTHMNTISIDPDNCYDIDDALDVVINGDDIFVNIHIADVSSYIPDKSIVDIELNTRVRSCYLQNTQHNMLPDNILNHCTLRENETKRAFTLSIHFDTSYSIIKHKFKKTLIVNKKQMTYSDANNIINGKDNDKYNINTLFDISKYVAQNYFDSVINQDILFDSHKMIEIYMLLINNLAANKIKKHYPEKVPLRCQYSSELKNTEKHDDILFELPNKSVDNVYDNQFCNLTHDISNEIKNKIIYHKMDAAKYCIGFTENSYHKTLNIQSYTHFSSPIRRYFDIVVHRYLSDIIHSKYDSDYAIDVDHINKCDAYYRKIENKSRILNTAMNLYKIDNMYNSRYNAFVISIEDNVVFVHIPELNLDCYSKLYSKKIDYIRKCYCNTDHNDNMSLRSVLCPISHGLSDTYIRNEQNNNFVRFTNIHNNKEVVLTCGDIVIVDIIVTMYSPKNKLLITLTDFDVI